jgi:hypothetical protein
MQKGSAGLRARFKKAECPNQKALASARSSSIRCRAKWAHAVLRQASMKEVGIDAYQFSEYLTCEFRWREIMQAAVSILRAS